MIEKETGPAMKRKNDYIGYADESSKTDMLGNSKYYDGLADFIIQCATPMTISIQGDWGTGKTTALNLIQQRIEEKSKNKYQVLWFNTWQYSKFGMEYNLTLSLMSNLYEKLNAVAKAKKLSAPEIPVKSILSKSVSTFVDAAVGGRAGNRTEAALNSLLGIESVTDAARQLEEIKNKIQKSINTIIAEDERLVIFIDDLDRLEPVVAVELLEGLKIFMDCERCVYVLAVDSSVVYQGVRQKYGEGFGEQKAKKYFDKIIQVPFSLPVNQYNMRQYIAQFIDNEDLAEKYENVVLKLLGSNPRSVKRAFNLLQLYELIMKDNVKTETDEINLFTIILFQMQNEAAYNKLAEAAKQSDDAVSRIIEGEDYRVIKEALSIDAFSHTDENAVNFIEMLVYTSQISVSTAADTKKEPVNYEKADHYIESLMQQVETYYKKVQVNSNVVNYLDKSGHKICSFRIKEKLLNIVVYRVDDSNDVKMPSFKELVNKADNAAVQENQLGYYKSADHVTYVDVQKCTNIELIRRVMKFYKEMYDS